MRLLLPFSLIGLLLFCSIVQAQSESSETNASSVVEQLNKTLLDVMKRADTLGYQGRRTQLESVIRTTHDLPFLARFSIGRKWGTLTPEQQAKWVALFSDYSISTYAERFNGFDGETFEVTSEKPMRGNKVVVQSLLTIPQAENHQFDYILQQNPNGAWQIVNVVVDGVSDLALKRAEYSTILSQDGFDALIKQLTDKIAGYGKG